MEDNGQLSYVKRVIHSLLVSAPEAMTIEALKRDYYRAEGIGVPFGSMGFRDIESFLRCIADTVLVVGYGPMASVYPISNAKTAHIQELVQFQKKQSNKSRNRGKRKPKYIYRSEPSDLVFLNERPRQTPCYRNRKPANTENRTMAQYYEVIQQRSKPLEIGSSNPIEAKQVISEQEDEERISHNDKKENCATIKDLWNADQSDEDQSDEDQSNKDISDENQSDQGDNDIHKEGSATGSPDSFQQEFFKSDYESSDEGVDEDAIPSYAVDKCVFNLNYPRSAVRSDYDLPEHKLEQSVMVGGRVQVQLVQVDNPHSFKFWIHDDSYDDYIAMNNNMQKFYNNLKSLEFVMPLFLITTDHLCVVRSNAVWERARVVNHKPEKLKKTIEVELIDTGRTFCVCPSDVHFLFKDFAILPPQCLPGRLAYVTPWKGSAWSAEAVQSFFQLVHYRILYAKVEQIENNSAYLLLVNPETEPKNIIKNINVRLIESGWARRCYTP